MINSLMKFIGVVTIVGVLATGCDSVVDNDASISETENIENKSFEGLASLASNVIEVTPDNPMGWTEENVRDDGASIISDLVSDQYGGNASLSQSFSDSDGKTDFRLLQSFGPVEDLTALGFDWYRDGSSTAPGHLTPAIGLFVADDNDNSWLLKWEGVYNGYPIAGTGAPTDEWITEDLLDANFWRIPQLENGSFVGFGGCNQAGDPYGCFQFDRTLEDDWLDGFEVVGIEIGIGSGWNGIFLSYADYVTINDTAFDFELELDPATKTDCMNGGWEDFGFSNQGQCIRFVNTGKDSR